MNHEFDRRRNQNTYYKNLTPLGDKINKNLNHSKVQTSSSDKDENIGNYNSNPVLSKAQKKTKTKSMTQIDVKNTPKKENQTTMHDSTERIYTEPVSEPFPTPFEFNEIKDTNALTDHDVESELKETLNELEPIMQSDVDKVSITSPLAGTLPIMKCVFHIQKPQLYKKISKKSGKEVTDWTKSIQTMLNNKNFIENVTYFNNELDEDSFKKMEEIFKKEPKNLRVERIKLINGHCLSLFKWVCVQKKIYVLRQLYIKSITPGGLDEKENQNLDTNKNNDQFNDSFGVPNSEEKKNTNGNQNDQLYNKETQFLNKIDKQLKLSKGLLNHIDDHEWNDQASVQNPPQILVLIFEALCHIFKPDLALSSDGKVEFWLSSKVFQQDKKKFFDKIISFDPETQMDYDTYINLLQLGDKNPQLHNLEYDEFAPPLISGLYTWISAQINIYYLMNIHYKNLDKEIQQARLRAFHREELVKSHEIIPEEDGCEDSFENLEIQKEDQPEVEETQIYEEVRPNLIQRESEKALDSKDTDTFITETVQSAHESRTDTNFYDSVNNQIMENADIKETLKKYNYYKTLISKDIIEQIKASCQESETAMKVLQALCYVLKAPIIKKFDHYNIEVMDLQSSIKNLLFDKKFYNKIIEFNYLLHLDDETYFKLKTFLQENDDLIRAEDASVNEFYNAIFVLYEWLKVIVDLYYLTEKRKNLTSADEKIDSIRKSIKNVKKKKASNVTSNNNIQTLKSGTNKPSRNNLRSTKKLPDESSVDNLKDPEAARKNKREQSNVLNNTNSRNVLKGSGVTRGSVDKEDHKNIGYDSEKITPLKNSSLVGGSTDKKSSQNINKTKNTNNSQKKIESTKQKARESAKYMSKLELQNELKENLETEKEKSSKNTIINLKQENVELRLQAEQLKMQVVNLKQNCKALHGNCINFSQKNKHLHDDLDQYDNNNQILMNNCQSFFDIIKESLDNLPSKKLRKTFPPKLCKSLDSFEIGIKEFQNGLSDHLEIIELRKFDRQKYTENDIVEVDVDLYNEELDEDVKKSETPKFQSDEEFEEDRQEVFKNIKPNSIKKPEKNSLEQKKNSSEPRKNNKNLMEKLNKAEVKRSEPKRRMNYANEVIESSNYEEPNTFKQTFGETGEYFDQKKVNNYIKIKENELSLIKSFEENNSNDDYHFIEEKKSFLRSQQFELEKQAEQHLKEKDSIKSKKNSNIDLTPENTPHSTDYVSISNMDMYADKSNNFEHPKPYGSGNPFMSIVGNSYMNNSNAQNQLNHTEDFEQAHKMMMDSMLNNDYKQGNFQMVGNNNMVTSEIPGMPQGKFQMLGNNNMITSEIMGMDQSSKESMYIEPQMNGARETFLVKNPGKNIGIEFGDKQAYKTEPNLHISELSMENSYPPNNKNSGYAMEQFMSQDNAEKMFEENMNNNQRQLSEYNNFKSIYQEPVGYQGARDTFPMINQEFIRINSMSNKSQDDEEKGSKKKVQEKAVTERSERNPKTRSSRKGSSNHRKIGNTLDNVSKTFRK